MCGATKLTTSDISTGLPSSGLTRMLRKLEFFQSNPCIAILLAKDE